ncbi:MAG: hypothetical protein ACI9X4_000682 [Glaciecola sp.]|jgi:hypothetical protein
MKLFATTLLCSSALLGFSETFETKAVEGEVLVRTFAFSSESSLESSSMLMDGEEVPGHGGEMEQESSFSTEYVVRDTHLEVADGQVASVERTYEQLEQNITEHMQPPMGEEAFDSEFSSESDLTDKSVVLTIEDDEVSAAWADGHEGDEGLLADLEICEDFGVLLPESAMELQGTWSLPPSLLEKLSAPLGDLHMEAEEGPDDMGDEGPEMPDEEFEGDIQATFAEIVEEDGRRLARVEFTVDVSSTVDMTEFVLAMTASENPDDMPEGAMVPDIKSMEHESTYVGSGTFLWDLKAGRLASFDLTCEITRAETVTMEIAMGAESVEIEQISEYAGTDTWSMRFESGQ